MSANEETISFVLGGREAAVIQTHNTVSEDFHSAHHFDGNVRHCGDMRYYTTGSQPSSQNLSVGKSIKNIIVSWHAVQPNAKIFLLWCLAI